MKHLINFLSAAIITFILYSCGDGVVDIGVPTYEPKIVIEGYIFPNRQVENIKIGRNFPLNIKVDTGSLFIPDAKVSMNDLEKNKEYQLTFNAAKKNYEYTGKDLNIDFGKSYKLNVKANIDGKELFASSTTTIPQSGLIIDRSASILDSMLWRETDQNRKLKYFKLSFIQSPSTNFYIISIIALDISTETYIQYDSHYHFYPKQSIWNYYIKDPTLVNGLVTFTLDWNYIEFYGRHLITVYTGDQNFANFNLKPKVVQDLEGNLTPAKSDIEGDGIGVFASVIADTAYFKVLKR
jgi:hypothetical protein